MTTNRRQFLIGSGLTFCATSAAPSLLTVLPDSTKRPIAANNPRLHPVRYLYDNRFEEALLFARSLNALGARTDGFAGDISALWFRDLSIDWDKSPSTIAGLTAQGALFCLEQLAHAAGMGVVLRINHIRRPAVSAHHSIAMKASHSLPIPDDLIRAGNDYPARLADILHHGHWSPQNLGITAPVSFSDQDPEPLVSWVIAPRQAIQSRSHPYEFA